MPATDRPKAVSQCVYPVQRACLRGLFDAALAAVDPALIVPPLLPGLRRPRGRTLVIGAGKAAAAMARAVELHWAAPLEGFVVTRHGYNVPCEHIEVVEAAHPVPDTAGMQAAQRALARVQNLTANDLVIALMSGGGSALMALPAPGITLTGKQAVTRQLLASGAAIGEINCVRKHLSAIKGGRLALAAQRDGAGARLLTLAISDVPGDDPSVIASGPTVADPTTCDDTLDILDRYRIEVPPPMREALLRGTAETPKPLDARLRNGEFLLAAGGMTALHAAAAAARAAGITPIILGDAIEGEAREVARALAGIALACVEHGLPASSPCVLLSGGETTVSVQGEGRGGRNGEFLLALALALRGNPYVHAIACDTDGIDGSENNAGAWLAPDTLARAAALGLSPRERLADNDAHGFFAALDDLVVTGPTMTNVNDFRAILIDRRS